MQNCYLLLMVIYYNKIPLCSQIDFCSVEQPDFAVNMILLYNCF